MLHIWCSNTSAYNLIQLHHHVCSNHLAFSTGTAFDPVAFF